MRGEGRQRTRDRRGGCSFVAEQQQEDVDPENKSTVLRFHHGKRLSVPLASTVKERAVKKIELFDICCVWWGGSYVSSFLCHL